ncbi:hypothetical protein [Sinorhizobium glycinis]|uniref:hypothetical protein n=1 Tax=Sinorhizobium glycinis TaxID=1472378 RepID=UPI000B086EED|nr:hypothetical protein [Sinorhizobium glycinis]
MKGEYDASGNRIRGLREIDGVAAEVILNDKAYRGRIYNFCKNPVRREARTNAASE